MRAAIRLPESFVTWADARHGALLRSAYLLTGDRHAAERLVCATLTQILLAWPRHHDPEGLHERARQALFDEWRAGWLGRPTRPAILAVGNEYDDARAEVWQALAELPPRERAVLVLRHYEGLPDTRIAELLRLSPAGVRGEAVRALDAVRDRLARRDEARPGLATTDPVHELTRTLADRAEEISGHRPDYPAVGVRVQRIRAGRRRATGWIAAASVVLVVLALLVFSRGEDPPPAATGDVPAQLDKPSGPPDDTPPLTRPTPISSLEQLPMGYPTRIGYLVDRTYYSPFAGRRIEFRFPQDSKVRALAPVGTGWLVTAVRITDGTTSLWRVSDGGATTRVSDRASPSLAPNGDALAYVTYRGRPDSPAYLTLTGAGELVQRIDGRINPVGLTDAGGVVYVRPSREEVWITDLVGPPRRIPALRRATVIEPRHGLVAGVAPSGAARVVDAATGSPMWDRPGCIPAAVNTHDNHVTASCRSGWQILDAASGETRTTIAIPEWLRIQRPSQVVWEDRTEQLMVAAEVHRGQVTGRAIIRIDPLGRIERATRVFGPAEDMVLVSR